MPIIHIEILEGRSDEKVRELINGITKITVQTLNVKPDQVRVIIHPIPRRYWGVGGITKEE
ncbi:4-oxalocrotonate tautomerase [[Bacillus] enclensis]|uniref:Tautomerase n=1 Tax=[Bacillus] enclensis TaxID=1402860 RepID=A0A0V8HL70_9BACI|nr:2-hydroxymuconate tautomerase family protein [[Bacillus] enclensis]KSU63318.1 4-oxalocrotonate tautomerase [[Bacillus] enclensis]QTC43167.1 2-hydroxymuconate tautomerase family protein [Bacillus sp. V3]SCB81809.1 4-oxalocrotonate tautomerase [[Bacillus] enclensis]